MRLRNPLVSVQRGRRDAEWLRYVSDDDLDVLMLIHAGAPATPETEALKRDIKARALSRMRQERQAVSALTSVSAEDSTDFATWLRQRWAQADATARHTLRTLATALGIPVPKEQQKRPAMRRTRPCARRASSVER